MIELAILTKLCIVICIWMELAYVWTMCMDETDVICDMKLMCWICDMEIYLYMSYIFAVKIVGFKKTEKMSQYAGSLASATDGKGLFAISSGRQRGHVAGNCASWELTHLVSWPTVADDKGRKNFAVSHYRQTAQIGQPPRKHSCLPRGLFAVG